MDEGIEPEMFPDFDSFEAEYGAYPEESSVTMSAPRATARMPEVVKNFILYFHGHIREGDTFEIHNIYENSFNKLTERYFKTAPWPSVDVISPLVQNDPLFKVLYKELYYRHIYSRLQVTVEQRCESFENYCELFRYVLDSDAPVQLELPNQWLWDIVDEFVYQFQTFCQYRQRPKKTAAELAVLKANPDCWHIDRVMNVLHSLVDTSKINEQLDVINAGGDASAVAQAAGVFGSHSLYRMLGYFALISLARVHCLLGGYHTALSTLSRVHLNRRGEFYRVFACHNTLFYYVGFAYLMLRRYQDAVRTFANVLNYFQRTKQYQSRSYQFEQLQKKNEQMLNLLAIAVTLCPQRIDEVTQIMPMLREKCKDKMDRMQAREEEVFEELFMRASPKFISPTAPSYDAVTTPSDDDAPAAPAPNKNLCAETQRRFFMAEVHQQLLLPTIRSYLKLYTSLPVSKLASYVEMEEDAFRAHLLCYKHKSHALVWSEGPPLSGAPSHCSDVDFFIDNDMIHVADTKVARKYGEYFARQIGKLEDTKSALRRPRKGKGNNNASHGHSQSSKGKGKAAR